MSRERKQRRDARRQSAFDFVTHMAKRIAAAERRTLNGPAETAAYVQELVERGVMVDMGPLPGSSIRRISFRLDKVPAIRDGNSLSSLADLIRKGIR